MLELGISVFVVRMLELGCGDMPHLMPTFKVKLESIVSYILKAFAQNSIDAVLATA